MVVPCSRLFLPVFARPSFFFFFFSGYDFTVTVNCDGVRRRCTVVSVEARSLQNGTVPVLVLAFLYRAAALGNRQLASVLPFFYVSFLRTHLCGVVRDPVYAFRDSTYVTRTEL